LLLGLSIPNMDAGGFTDLTSDYSLTISGDIQALDIISMEIVLFSISL